MIVDCGVSYEVPHVASRFDLARMTSNKISG